MFGNLVSEHAEVLGKKFTQAVLCILVLDDSIEIFNKAIGVKMMITIQHINNNQHAFNLLLKANGKKGLGQTGAMITPLLLDSTNTLATVIEIFLDIIK